MRGAGGLVNPPSISVGFRNGGGLFLLITQAVKNLRSGQKDRAGASGHQQPAAKSGKAREIMAPALQTAECQSVNDEAGFPPGLDNEQSADFFNHGHRKANAVPSRMFRESGASATCEV